MEYQYRASIFKLRKVLSDKNGKPYWEVLDGSGKVVYLHGTKTWCVDWIIGQNFWRELRYESSNQIQEAS
jgi:hypothetical protein